MRVDIRERDVEISQKVRVVVKEVGAALTTSGKTNAVVHYPSTKANRKTLPVRIIPSIDQYVWHVQELAKITVTEFVIEHNFRHKRQKDMKDLTEVMVLCS